MLKLVRSESREWRVSLISLQTSVTHNHKLKCRKITHFSAYLQHYKPESPANTTDRWTQHELFATRFNFQLLTRISRNCGDQFDGFCDFSIHVEITLNTRDSVVSLICVILQYLKLVFSESGKNISQEFAKTNTSNYHVRKNHQ